MIEIPESANHRVRLIYVSISIYFDRILSHRDEVTGPYLLPTIRSTHHSKCIVHHFRPHAAALCLH
jgi:hypothetical protein